MQVQPEIAYREVPRSPAVEELISKKVEKLSRLCPELIKCRISVEAPHRSRRTGNLYSVRIDMVVPEQELVVSHEKGDEDIHSNLQAAVRSAFQRAERQIRDYAARKQRQVKEHYTPAVGKIARLQPDERSGYIETPDGREFFFDEASLLQGNIEELEIGEHVSFAQTVDDRPSHAIGIVRMPGTG